MLPQHASLKTTNCLLVVMLYLPSRSKASLGQCSQQFGAECRALATNSPVSPGQGWYGLRGKTSILDIQCITVDSRQGPAA